MDRISENPSQHRFDDRHGSGVRSPYTTIAFTDTTMSTESASPQPRQNSPRIAVVTAIGGGKDRLEPPRVRFESADYLLYTDDPTLRVEGWETRSLPIWSTDPVYARRRHARAVKILTTMLVPGYDFYIWHDGTHEVLIDPIEIVERFLPTPEDHFAVHRHKSRNCFYEEAKSILSVKLDDPDNVRRQIRDYRNAGLPRHAGLWETPVVIRRAGQRTRRLELAWWDQLARYSSRDQLALPFVAHSLGFRLTPLPGPTGFRNDYIARVRPHCFPDATRPPLFQTRRRLRHLMDVFSSTEKRRK